MSVLERLAARRAVRSMSPDTGIAVDCAADRRRRDHFDAVFALQEWSKAVILRNRGKLGRELIAEGMGGRPGKRRDKVTRSAPQQG